MSLTNRLCHCQSWSPRQDEVIGSGSGAGSHMKMMVMQLLHVVALVCDYRKHCTLMLAEEGHTVLSILKHPPKKVHPNILAYCAPRAHARYNAKPGLLDASSINASRYPITNPRLGHKLVYLCFPSHRPAWMSDKGSR